ncbi:MAG: peptidylprolyl isomerase [Candidatus Omnitrophica bacterium]|nr:peptidylprolyl isomerase [Candidatus Omnitrophota bacterium]
MLKLIRKKGIMKKVVWIIANLIILSFGLFGTATLLTRKDKSNSAGKIFNKKITLEDFDRHHRAVVAQGLMRYGKEFYSLQQTLNLDAETWDRLILLAEAKNRGIQVADSEVVEKIQSIPFFQSNGQFDSRMYDMILRQTFRMPARAFEEATRDSIAIAKLFDAVTSPFVVTDQDALAVYNNKNEKAQVSYVPFLAEDFKQSVNATDGEAKEYFGQHTAEFTRPPMINVEYLHLAFAPPPEAVKPGAEKKSADETAKDKTRDQAKVIFQEMRQKTGLENISEKYSVPLLTSGFFSMDQPNLSLGWSYDQLTRLFQLDKNDPVTIFETTDGVDCVKIKEWKPSATPEYNTIQEEVRQKVLTQKALVLAREKAAETLTKIHAELPADASAEDFRKTAQKLNLNVLPTPLFVRGDYLAKLGPSPKFQEAAFALTKADRISSVIEIPNGFCFIHLDDKAPADPAQFEAQKEKITESLLRQKHLLAFNEFLVKLRSAAHLEDHISLQNSGEK